MIKNLEAEQIKEVHELKEYAKTHVDELIKSGKYSEILDKINNLEPIELTLDIDAVGIYLKEFGEYDFEEDLNKLKNINT